jgi:hypothetical protein
MQVLLKELIHPAGVFFRVKLAGVAMTCFWQPPEHFGLPGSCVKLIEIRQVRVMIAVDEQDRAG